MSKISITNNITYFYWTLGLIPCIWIMLVLVNYLITGFELGHLPKYGIDGGQYRYPLPYSSYLNMFLMITTMWSTLIVPFILLGHFLLGFKVKSFPKLTVKLSVISYLGCGLFILSHYWEPFSDMMTWYID